MHKRIISVSILTFCAIALAPLAASAQSKSQIISKARKSLPGHSKYKYLTKKKKVEGLRVYYDHYVRAYKKAGT